MNRTHIKILWRALALWLCSSLLALSASAAVTITATPNTSPVQIQPAGGNFDVTLEVNNLDTISRSFDLWTIATRPDGSEVNPVNGVEIFTLPGTWAASSRITQTLTATDPEGLYTYTTAVGVYPSIVWNSSSVTVEKLPEPPPGGGTGWYSQATGTTKYLTDIQFTDALNGWAVGITNTILHTIDGGDNWYPQVSPPSTNYYAVHFVDALNGWAAGSAGRIAHTRDGGNTWLSQTSGTSQGINGVYFVDANTGWFVGGKFRSFTAPYQFIYKTEDGGNTWVRQFYRSNKDPLKRVVFVDKEVGWAIGEAGVILNTQDGGKSWNEQNSGTPLHLYGIHFITKELGWIVGRNGTALYTTNAGKTWTPRDVGVTDSLSDVQFSDSQNGWIVSGTGLILHTQDGGSTWQQQSAATTNALSSISVVDSATAWAAGLSGTIIHTTTGGN